MLITTPPAQKPSPHRTVVPSQSRYRPTTPPPLPPQLVTGHCAQTAARAWLTRLRGTRRLLWHRSCRRSSGWARWATTGQLSLGKTLPISRWARRWNWKWFPADLAWFPADLLYPGDITPPPSYRLYSQTTYVRDAQRKPRAPMPLIKAANSASDNQPRLYSKSMRPALYSHSCDNSYNGTGDLHHSHQPPD
jgi:hypothetical protein